MNIVMAMNMGGDDFIAKPFDLTVLTAKVQAMLRRTYDFGTSSSVLEHRGAMLNTGDATLTYEGEKNRPDQKRVQNPPASSGEQGTGGQQGRHHGQAVGRQTAL